MNTAGGFRTGAGRATTTEHLSLAAVAVGAIASIMAALASNGSYRKLYNKASFWSSGTAKRLTATITGTAADVAANQVTIIGTDEDDAPLTEALPAFTLNTLGSVTSVGSFKTVTEIRMPAHDGVAVSISIGVLGSSATDVLAAWVDKGVQTIHKCDATINNPSPERNVTATAGGTAGDIKAISVIVNGTNSDNDEISETLPAFTVNIAGTVVGNFAFKTIDSIEIPPHDDVAATTSIGTGAKLGLGRELTRNTILFAYLNQVKEAVAPTVVVDPDEVHKNTATLDSALDGSPVDLYYLGD
jgi:hypothetical protein